jgi:hypothetical protein
MWYIILGRYQKKKPIHQSGREKKPWKFAQSFLANTYHTGFMAIERERGAINNIIAITRTKLMAAATSINKCTMFFVYEHDCELSPHHRCGGRGRASTLGSPQEKGVSVLRGGRRWVSMHARSSIKTSPLRSRLCHYIVFNSLHQTKKKPWYRMGCALTKRIILTHGDPVLTGRPRILYKSSIRIQGRL